MPLDRWERFETDELILIRDALDIIDPVEPDERRRSEALGKELQDMVFLRTHE